MSIEIQNITKDFGSTRALNQINLSLGGDKIYGLLGNNGAGKTTLLNIITDRLAATDGTVTIDGEPAQSGQATKLVFLVGDRNLFPDDMRVKQAFKLAPSFYPDFDRQKAEELTSQFGLNPKQKINRLSTGYASIFRLILGLCVNTPYLIFDEPVLGLDARHRDLFYRRLMESYAAQPRTIIISTHLIAEVENLIEHTIIIHNGKILQECANDELLHAAHTVSGPTGLMDEYLSGKQVLSTTVLGGLKTACVRGTATGVPSALEVTPANLQDYFISLMEEEDQKC